MTVRAFLTVLFFSCGIQFSEGVTFEEANAAFRGGDYQKAADGYEKVLRSKGHSAAVYYNLGNAYQKMEMYGSAILAYERARLIDPRDPDLRANLELARKAVSAFDGETGNVFLHYFSRNEWTWVVVVTAFIGAGIVFLAGCKRFEKRWMKRAAVGGICVSVVVIVVAGTVLFLRSGEGDRAVVVSKDAVIRLSPFGTAGSVGTPGEGRMVTLGKQKGDFWYVTGEGMSGWMAERDVERVEGR